MERMKKKTFLSVFGWMGPGCFLLEPTKKFSPQNGKKTEGRKWDCLMDKNAHVQFLSSSSFFFFFFLVLGMLPLPFLFLFFFFSFLDVASFFFFLISWAVGGHVASFFFYSFLFFFSILSWTLPPFLFLFWGVVGVIVVFFCFFCLTRHVFYFLINLVIAFFFLSLFLF